MHPFGPGNVPRDITPACRAEALCGIAVFGTPDFFLTTGKGRRRRVSLCRSSKPSSRRRPILAAFARTLAQRERRDSCHSGRRTDEPPINSEAWETLFLE